MTERADDRPSAPPAGESLGDRAALALLEYREGRSQRLADLVHEATPLLWHTARSQGVPRDLADDVVQSTWAALVRHVDTIDEPKAVLSWLLVTTRRASWDVVRRYRAQTRLTTELPDDATDTSRAIVSPHPGPEELALRTDRDRALWAAVGELSERCRILLRLVAQADRPDYRAISEAVGMPVGSIGATRGRCLAKLRTVLERETPGEVGS
ncbi:RNA polymerase sigma factor [Cellulomonas sp. PhB143]|uniref:RNA polymerase sigma factor n=1 Tax=Cellulomonas sp. PhB143 TaxID=2485186 RepID=UPI000FC362A4|nr:sigma-70 family RNA polymerase sigma factor [Cellulomonas sp. PhB143]ROS76765.1 RNA polymerase sigma factor (sigma-70 family) [Cellulomonas sp. PhB143]